MVLNEGPNVFTQLYCILSNCNMGFVALSSACVHLIILCYIMYLCGKFVNTTSTFLSKYYQYIKESVEVFLYL